MSDTATAEWQASTLDRLPKSLRPHLQDEAVALVAQRGDELVDELAGEAQGPEVLAPHTEGLALVYVAARGEWAAGTGPGEESQWGV